MTASTRQDRRPQLLLRYGMARDKQLMGQFARERLFDTLVVPGNVLAYQSNATPAAVREIGLPYLVDPMSHMFASQDWCRSDGAMRPSVEKLLETLGARVCAICGDEKRALLPSDLASSVCADIAEATVRFQGGIVSQASSRAIDRYFRFLGRTSPLGPGEPPAALVAPYFRVDTSLSWLQPNIHLIESLAQIESGPICAVLFFDKQLLAQVHSGVWQEVLQAYESCAAQTVLLWPDDLPDDFRDTDAGTQVGLAVRRLSTAEKETYALYGGYFFLMLHRLGLRGVSHGILYTQHKSVEAGGGPSGPPPLRYYFPQFHQFRTITQAARICATPGFDVPCDCEVCHPVFQGDPTRIVLFDNPVRCKAHFIRARRAEAEAVRTKSLDEVTTQLRETHRVLDAVVSGLVNPDSSVHAPMSGLGHLLAWANVLDRLAVTGP